MVSFDYRESGNRRMQPVAEYIMLSLIHAIRLITIENEKKREIYAAIYA